MFWSNLGWMGGPTKVAVWQAGRWYAQPYSAASNRVGPAGHGNQWAAGVQQMSGAAERGDDTTSTTISTNIKLSDTIISITCQIQSPSTSKSLATGRSCDLSLKNHSNDLFLITFHWWWRSICSWWWSISRWWWTIGHWWGRSTAGDGVIFRY